MVTLVVATTTDPASINPAAALIAMPGWQSGPSFEGIRSFRNQQVRLLQHDKGIVEEDHLDLCYELIRNIEEKKNEKTSEVEGEAEPIERTGENPYTILNRNNLRWREVAGEEVDELIFLSKHTAVSNRPALTVHPIGVPHLRDDEVPPQGGKPGWAALPDPRIGPWLRLLKKIAESHNLVPEFEITLEGTHHGPETNKPAMFVEIGSTEEYWKRPDAAQVVSLLIWEGLGLGGAPAVGHWSSSSENDKKKVLLGIGGGHYAPRHMDIVLNDGVWVGHLLSGYTLPMEDPGKSKVDPSSIGGTWRKSIQVAYETPRSAFPGGEIIAHLDHKSFKSWQKAAITGFLSELNIKIGKPNDFY